MAGIGFQLRKIVKKDSFFSLVKMYSYSAMLSSGAWVISVIAILLVGIINIALSSAGNDVLRLQIIITYAFALAASLVITGFLQLPLTRYIADLIFAKRESEVFGSYMGVMFVVLGGGMAIFIPAVWVLLPELNSVQHFLITAVFLTLSAIWISNVLVSSLKYYKSTVLSYFVVYAFIVVASYFYGTDLNSLLFIFFSGNALLLTIMITLIYKSYDSKNFMHFKFFKHKGFYYTLAFAGLFYNMGTWIDKFIFWYHPLTGSPVIGKIHSSVVYDLPIFLAYLSLLPGMAVFFYRLEADFAEKYDNFYNAVREGGTLFVIKTYKSQMIATIRLAIKEVIWMQSIVTILIFLVAPEIFSLLRIPQLYLDLFYVLTIGALLQLGVMSILAILYYLDRRTKAMWLSFLFFILNGTMSWISIYLGPSYFGYGYALSLLIVFIISILVIRQTMERLEYETFMHQ